MKLTIRTLTIPLKEWYYNNQGTIYFTGGYATNT